MNFVNNWQIRQCRIFVNMQLCWFFSTFIAFFSDFVHFTLKLFKILYYFCTAIQKSIARSSHVHRVTIAHTYTCSQQAHMVFPADASRVLKLWTRFPKIIKILFEYNEKFCLILRNFVLYKKPKQVYLVLLIFTPARFIPNPLVPAPRSYLSGGHGGNWLWV